MNALFIYPQITMRGNIPIALTTLCAVLRTAGHSVTVFDCSQYVPKDGRGQTQEAIGMFLPAPEPPVPRPMRDLMNIEEDLYNAVNDFNPDLICFTATTGTYSFGLRCSNIIKKKFPNIPIIFGGVHPTFCPEEVINEKSVDFICIGEGEDALLELCNAIEEKKPVNRIKNIWAKDKKDHKNIYKNPTRMLKDLDTLPVQDFSDFDTYEFYRPLDGKTLKMMNTDISRGCVFKCTYCANAEMQKLFKDKGNYHRWKSPDIAIKHLEELKGKYGFEIIRFWDEDFTTFPVRYLREFSALYKKRINLPFLIYAGTRTITEEKVACLKEMNCVTIAMAIESGNPWIRKNLLNRNISDAEIIKKYEIVKNSNIRVSAYNMIGLPFETRKMVFDTINLNRKVKADTSSVSPFKPYPKTRLGEVSKEFGFLQKEPDYSSNNTDLDSPYLRREEIDGLLRTFPLYVKLPEKFFPLLEKCEKDEMFAVKTFPDLVKHLEKTDK